MIPRLLDKVDSCEDAIANCRAREIELALELMKYKEMVASLEQELIRLKEENMVLQAEVEKYHSSKGRCGWEKNFIMGLFLLCFVVLYVVNVDSRLKNNARGQLPLPWM